MVLLPDPSKYHDKPPPRDPASTRSIFFEHSDLDQMARHFIGNNYR